MISKILVLLGPNLNKTGEREPKIYGKEDYSKINEEIIEYGGKIGFKCTIYQSNHEGHLIDKIQTSSIEFCGIILNAGALSHYSISIYDALLNVKIPVVEVHMSNIYNRDKFRQKSVLSKACIGQIVGFGKNVYTLGLEALKNIIFEEN